MSRRATGLAAAAGACLVACLVAGVAARSVVVANGGPFVIKYPKGDPAAKGVLARLSDDLRPARETRLRVVKEDLGISFELDPRHALALAIHAKKNPKGTRPEPLPLVRVTAAYTIENPTGEEVTVDFGFPILRGVYTSAYSMSGPIPDVTVDVDGKRQRATIISNSAIYGIIRKRARAAIDLGVEGEPDLKRLVARAKLGKPKAREALRGHLVDVMNWTARDAALMVEYAGLSFERKKNTPRVYPADGGHHYWGTQDLYELAFGNLGPLAAIGEQKTTQFFARLASRFDPAAAAAYESIFSAWGGDVRERSVDVDTGKVRAREITVDPKTLKATGYGLRGSDPTIYARVNYFDENAKISKAEKAACRTVLKNLPVVFTFAPMNLIHYQVKFPAGSRQVLTVRYRQYAYIDTRGSKSYQLAYVVHPASLWDDFGPINLEVAVPAGVGLRASVPTECTDVDERAVAARPPYTPKETRQTAAKRLLEEIARSKAGYTERGTRQTVARAPKVRMTVYRATLATAEEKKGELLLGIRADSWQRAAKPALAPKLAQQGQAQSR